MNDYLMDQATLGKFVDELIKRKALSVNSTEELNSLREKSMKELDDRIATALFGGLTDEQATELDQILDRDNGTAEPYQDFFRKIGMDVEQVTANAMQSYAADFLGGQNE